MKLNISIANQKKSVLSNNIVLRLESQSIILKVIMTLKTILSILKDLKKNLKAEIDVLNVLNLDSLRLSSMLRSMALIALIRL